MDTYDIITKLTLLLAAGLFLWLLITGSLNPFQDTVKDKVQQANGNMATKEICDLKLKAGQEDTDKDGVPNSCDYCYNTPETVTQGETDTDGDGVPDACDKNKDNYGSFKQECKNIISEENQKCDSTNPT